MDKDKWVSSAYCNQSMTFCEVLQRPDGTKYRNCTCKKLEENGNSV